MLTYGLDLAKVLVIKGSYLEKDIETFLIPYDLIESKQQLLAVLEEIDFDILVANGCPYILPISRMPKRHYVNIHPSYLPDLRGVDPALGALLFQRDCGATVHLMEDGIDTGDIISQVRIPYTPDLDIALLYQLSFLAEKEAFQTALNLEFKPQYPQTAQNDLIYFTRKPSDRMITFSERPQVIINKVKAFSNRNQGCLFTHNNKEYKVHCAKIMVNPYLYKTFSDAKNRQILLSYEDCIVFKIDDQIIQFSKLSGNAMDFVPGTIIGQD